MKKLFALAAAMMLCLGMSAQIVTSTSRNLKVVREKTPKTTTWIMRVGLNLMKFTGDDAEDCSRKLGYDYSVEFNKQLGNVNGLYWGMEFGLGSRGYKYEEDDYDEKMMCHNARISPFIIGYKYSISNGFAVEGHLGAFVSCDYTGKLKEEYNGYSEDSNMSDWENFQRVDAGFRLGAGFWYNNVNLDFTWHRGMINAIKEDCDGFKASNFMIRLGFAF